MPTPEPISERPAVTVGDPVLRMRWLDLVYAHWRVSADTVAALLPDGLEPDTFDGSAWVGLIPFRMRDIRPPGLDRGAPWATNFPETNVRTYVIGPDGTRGVWFHSLDISRLAGVAVARTTYRLPYNWAAMDVVQQDRRWTYTARRRWPGPRGARSALTVEAGDPVPSSDLDLFLAARWRLFAVSPDRGLIRATVDHPPWRLHEARLLHLHDEFLAAAGYATPAQPPEHLRYTPGVDVRVGRPEPVG